MSSNVLLPNQNFPGSNNMSQMMGMGMPNSVNKKAGSNIQDPPQSFSQDKVHFCNFFILICCLDVASIYEST